MTPAHEIRTSSPDADLLLDRPCPACGYDLRALTLPGGEASSQSSARCPECGLAVTVEMLSAGANGAWSIPWVFRHESGRRRAFVRTLRLTLRRPWQLARSTVHPVDPTHARRFAAWCVWPCGIALALATVGYRAAVMHNSSGPPASFLGNQFLSGNSELIDLLLPLARALPTLAVPALSLAVFAICWLLPRAGAVPMSWVRTTQRPSAPTALALRAAGLSPYAAAGLIPLTLGLLTALTYLSALQFAAFRDFVDVRSEFSLLIFPLLILGNVSFFWGLAVILGTPLLLARHAGASPSRLVIGALAMLSSLALALLALLVAVFWLPGYLMLAVDVLFG